MPRVCRFFSPEFKLQVVREVEAGATMLTAELLNQIQSILVVLGRS
jgi:transposase-like protein